MVCPSDMSLGPVGHHGLSVSLGLKRCNLVVQIGTVSSVPILQLYFEHSQLPPGMQSPVQNKFLFQLGPIYIAPRGTSVDPCNPPAGYVQGLSTQGNFPHSQLQSFSLVDRSSWNCASQSAKGVCLDSAHLHCCSSPMSTHFMDLGGHLEKMHQQVHLVVPITF